MTCLTICFALELQRATHSKNAHVQCLLLQEIAETKMPDLNATTVEAGMKIIEGTAKNMGITVVEA